MEIPALLTKISSSTIVRKGFLSHALVIGLRPSICKDGKHGEIHRLKFGCSGLQLLRIPSCDHQFGPSGSKYSRAGFPNS
jgi:hypothetical protein